jgi:phage terminase large subunit-like protein
MSTTLQRPTPPGALAEVARHVVLPTGIVSTGWPAVRDKARDLGVTFDPWQDGAGQVILSKRADGSYACSIGGVVISIPRQVGKTFLIGAIVFALCLLNPGLTVIWTAHHTTTSNQTFQSMQGFAKRKKVAPFVDRVLLDAMTVFFVNGSTIMFGARERGFGRGLAQVGVLVFDEGQILTERAASDMVPTTNTVADALVIYTGTPPKPTDPSEVFTNRRAEALAGDSDDMAYIEFSADPDAKPLDKKQWRKANASYPTRTNDAAMMRMHKNLGPGSFLREALGVWDAKETGGPISLDRWAELVDTNSSIVGEVSTAIDVSPDLKWTSVVSAGLRTDGHIHVEVGRRQPGTEWVVPFAAANPQYGPYRVAGSGPAGFLLPLLAEADADAVNVPAGEVTQACARLIAAVDDGTIHHLGSNEIAAALSNATIANRGDAQAWSRVKSSGDISALVAATIAVGGVSAEASDPQIYF